jgi:hypothetical protein
MTLTQAEQQAAQNSIDYKAIMYVCEVKKGKKYSVVSEDRYNSRGLEDKIMGIYECGHRTA